MSLARRAFGSANPSPWGPRNGWARCGWWAVLASLALAGCGWHAGTLTRPGARTVAVQVFTSREVVLERDLEQALHQELSRAVSDLSGLALVDSGEADLIVRGDVLEYRRRSGIRSPENFLLETAIRLVASAELVDGRTGKVLRKAAARNWSATVLSDPGYEVRARERGLHQVAETIALELFRPFDDTGEPVPQEPRSGELRSGEARAGESPPGESPPDEPSTGQAPPGGS